MMEKPNRVGIVGKPGGDAAVQYIPTLGNWLAREYGVAVLIDAELEEFLSSAEGDWRFCSRAELGAETDMIVVLGGDGTMLGMARLVSLTQTPLLGVNLGRLGFLAEVGIDQMYNVLELMFNGEARTETRMMLRVHLHRMGERFSEHRVLNDVVINKGTLARMTELDVMINKQFLTSLRSDGMIVSTPTGSTAYNLAAGGPIIHPTMNNMVITPICPHMLTNRSIVVPARDTELEIRVRSRNSELMLTLDGQVGVALHKDDVIHIYRSENSLQLLTHPSKNYYQVLKEKMKWAE